MNSTIKALEKIGQNTSIKQHDSLTEMLKEMEVNIISLDDMYTNDMICIQVHDDDDDDINR